MILQRRGLEPSRRMIKELLFGVLKEKKLARVVKEVCSGRKASMDKGLEGRGLRLI